MCISNESSQKFFSACIQAYMIVLFTRSHIFPLMYRVFWAFANVAKPVPSGEIPARKVYSVHHGTLPVISQHQFQSEFQSSIRFRKFKFSPILSEITLMLKTVSIRNPTKFHFHILQLMFKKLFSVFCKSIGIVSQNNHCMQEDG